MNTETRTTLVELLVDLAIVPYQKGKKKEGDRLITLAGEVASGKPTVFDKLERLVQ